MLSEIPVVLIRQHQRFVAVARFDRAIAFLLDVVTQERHQRRFVLRDQDQRLARNRKANGIGAGIKVCH